MRNPLIIDAENHDWMDVLQSPVVLAEDRNGNRVYYLTDDAGNKFPDFESAQKYADQLLQKDPSLGKRGNSVKALADSDPSGHFSTDDLFHFMTHGLLGGYLGKQDYDGIIIKNVDDSDVSGNPRYATDYLFTDPKQLVSAIRNSGDFAHAPRIYGSPTREMSIPTYRKSDGANGTAKMVSADDNTPDNEKMVYAQSSVDPSADAKFIRGVE